MNKTAEVLLAMMTENTGRALGDSGDHYGRNYERNAGVDFSNQPEWEFDFRYGIEVQRNIYPWLCDILTYDEEMQERFDGFCKGKDEYDLTLMEEFADEMEDDSFSKREIINTYNGDCNLSQTLQFRIFKHGGQDYVLLQIHGGCDVRGGYTSPKVFTLDEYDIYNVADGYLACSECEANWSTDDNYHWYADGACGLGAGKELQDYERVEIEDIAELPEHRGMLVIDPDGNPRCPHCGGIIH